LLIDPETLDGVWADTRDYELTDVFSVQSDLATRFAAALETELSPADLGLLASSALSPSPP
jgi:TolB-like protein